MTFGDLPAINACLNGASALFLGAGYVLIRQGRWRAHRGFMLAAFITSTIFLLCYLTYHGYLAYVLHRGPTRFLEPAWFRPIYLFVLLTHTLLAIVIVPMILVTLVRGLRERFDKHRRIARWTWPLWMYVSVTGVLIYFLPSDSTNIISIAPTSITPVTDEEDVPLTADLDLLKQQQEEAWNDHENTTS